MAGTQEQPRTGNVSHEQGRILQGTSGGAAATTGGRTMLVSEAMSRDVQIANPNHSICDAAKMMAVIDAGVLPVGENDRLVGMITDRDIAVRAIALGKGPNTPVREVMSKE